MKPPGRPRGQLHTRDGTTSCRVNQRSQSLRSGSPLPTTFSAARYVRTFCSRPPSAACAGSAVLARRSESSCVRLGQLDGQSAACVTGTAYEHWWFMFDEHQRSFQVLVAFGSQASQQTKTDVWNVLNSMYMDYPATSSAPNHVGAATADVTSIFVSNTAPDPPLRIDLAQRLPFPTIQFFAQPIPTDHPSLEIRDRLKGPSRIDLAPTLG
jgi:hypothetical protein